MLTDVEQIAKHDRVPVVSCRNRPALPPTVWAAMLFVAGAVTCRALEPAAAKPLHGVRLPGIMYR